MAKYKVHYSSYNDCSQATEYSRNRAVRGFYLFPICIMCSIMLIIFGLDKIDVSWKWFLTASCSLFFAFLIVYCCILYYRCTDKGCQEILLYHQRELSIKERDALVKELQHSFIRKELRLFLKFSLYSLLCSALLSSMILSIYCELHNIINYKTIFIAKIILLLIDVALITYETITLVQHRR